MSFMHRYRYTVLPALIAITALMSGCQWFQSELSPTKAASTGRPAGVEGYPPPKHCWCPPAGPIL